MLVDTILKVRFQFSSVRFLINRASLMKVESLLYCNEFSDFLPSIVGAIPIEQTSELSRSFTLSLPHPMMIT